MIHTPRQSDNPPDVDNPPPDDYPVPLTVDNARDGMTIQHEDSKQKAILGWVTNPDGWTLTYENDPEPTGFMRDHFQYWVIVEGPPEPLAVSRAVASKSPRRGDTRTINGDGGGR